MLRGHGPCRHTWRDGFCWASWLVCFYGRDVAILASWLVCFYGRDVAILRHCLVSTTVVRYQKSHNWNDENGSNMQICQPCKPNFACWLAWLAFLGSSLLLILSPSYCRCLVRKPQLLLAMTSAKLVSTAWCMMLRNLEEFRESQVQLRIGKKSLFFVLTCP
jgi:hypothetical protein